MQAETAGQPTCNGVGEVRTPSSSCRSLVTYLDTTHFLGGSPFPVRAKIYLSVRIMHMMNTTERSDLCTSFAPLWRCIMRIRLQQNWQKSLHCRSSEAEWRSTQKLLCTNWSPVLYRSDSRFGSSGYSHAEALRVMAIMCYVSVRSIGYIVENALLHP